MKEPGRVITVGVNVMETNVQIMEVELTQDVLDMLISMSEAWEAENICHGYRKNDRADIEGNRIFAAFDHDKMVGYLFGHIEHAEKTTSIMSQGTIVFEVEELYVIPELRSNGIGGMLFSYAEKQMQHEAEYIMLSTATKNWKAILHFYLDELDMEFWSARLFKRIQPCK